MKNEKGMNHKTHSFLCTPAGARTLDPLIKSQMLYQLSYKRIFLHFLHCKMTLWSLSECKGTIFSANCQIFHGFFV